MNKNKLNSSIWKYSAVMIAEEHLYQKWSFKNQYLIKRELLLDINILDLIDALPLLSFWNLMIRLTINKIRISGVL